MNSPYGRKLRQQGALERLREASFEGSKAYQNLGDLSQRSSAEVATAKLAWCGSRDDQIEILERRVRT